MNERFQIGVKLIASHIILIIGSIFIPIVFTTDAFLSLAISQTILVILFFSGYWEFFGIGFKKYFCALLELMIVLVFVWRLQKNPNWNFNYYLVLCLALVQAYFLFELIKIVIVINKRDRFFMDLEFPFKSGNYLITDGGNSRLSRLMNYHYYSPIHKKNKTNHSMLYATDIVKIEHNKLTFLPKSNDRYPIFGEKIYSPMNGVIVKVENTIADNSPFSGNYPYNTGNTVVIKKDNYYLLLGHLMKNSITVKVGDVVQIHDLLGSVGNSGWTERPHLHMQLIESDTSNYWFGQGVCIQYDKRNLFKNRLIQV